MKVRLLMLYNFELSWKKTVFSEFLSPLEHFINSGFVDVDLLPGNFSNTLVSSCLSDSAQNRWR
jgi:hypothetical protein